MEPDPTRVCVCICEWVGEVTNFIIIIIIINRMNEFSREEDGCFAECPRINVRIRSANRFLFDLCASVAVYQWQSMIVIW